ncbi:MAG: NAD(P)H-dependent glycerol-3-phosphate dehydrogenase [Candidatus Omnitrophota bacterium]
MGINRIAILGDGGWGTTLSILLSKKGLGVSLWSVCREYADFLDKKRLNVKFLPGIPIPKNINISSDLYRVLSGAEVVVLAIPSPYLRSVLKKLEPQSLDAKVIVSAIKGIENNSLMRMSEVIRDVLGNLRVSVLSGPTIAREVALGIPSTAVIASSEPKTSRLLQAVFMTNRFRIYTNDDVIGVELGGSIKNIIAIACGICDGLKFGANTKAALLTRGLAEMNRLGAAMGAKAHTFYGLSGLGDLVTTCSSVYSRNRGLGEKIGAGKKIKEIIAKMEMVAEGVPTTKSVYELSKKYKVDMPITKEVYRVLYKNKSPLAAVDDLMARRRREE